MCYKSSCFTFSNNFFKPNKVENENTESISMAYTSYRFKSLKRKSPTASCFTFGEKFTLNKINFFGKSQYFIYLLFCKLLIALFQHSDNESNLLIMIEIS